MKESGQRQDLAFLALAVAVLAIAVALFVGMKSMPQKPAAETEAEAQQESAEEPAEPAAPEPTGRDPFKSQAKGSAAQAGRGHSGPGLRLVGIVRRAGEPPMAVVVSGQKRYYAHVGERAGSYTVVSVSREEAVLEAAGDRITLRLREPPPADEGAS